MLIPFLAPLLVYLEAAFVFYPLVVALLFLSIVCLPEELSPLEKRHNGGNPSLSMVFSILVYAVVLYHFGIDVSTWKHWLPLLGIYLVIGVVWATGKWWNFCGKVRDTLKETVDRFTRTVDDDDNAEDVARSFMSYLIVNNHGLRKYKSAPYVNDTFKPWPRAQVIDLFIPQVTAHKAVVLTWLFCWPISVLKWALADMLRDLYNGVFAAIQGAFQKIAASRFSDISKERTTISREETRFDHYD
jgi:hypothetical protein